MPNTTKMPRGYYLSIQHQYPNRDGSGGHTKIQLYKKRWLKPDDCLYSFQSLDKMIDGATFQEIHDWFIQYAHEIKRNKCT